MIAEIILGMIDVILGMLGIAAICRPAFLPSSFPFIHPSIHLSIHPINEAPEIFHIPPQTLMVS